jgi:hypothetical protein
MATQMRDARRQREAVQAIYKARGDVDYDCPPPHALDPNDPFAAPPSFVLDLVAKFLGRDFLGKVVAAKLVVEDVAGLEVLRDVEHVFVPDGMKSGKILPQLHKLPRLRWLSLDSTNNGDLQHLKDLTQLEDLDLDGTSVTDEGLRQLAALTQLKKLGLSSCEVTDAGLEHLKGLKKLRVLNLWDTKITEEGARRLQQALPNCQIDLDGPIVTS